MNDESERPLSILITQGVLLLATLLFSILVAIDLTAGGAINSFLQVAMYVLLLVMLPATALIGLWNRSAWGRNLSILSIIGVWAFALKVGWSFFVFPGELRDAVFRVPLAALIFVLLLTVLVGLPSLLLKLIFGSSEAEYLSGSTADPQQLTPGHPDYIADAIPGLDESFIER